MKSFSIVSALALTVVLALSTISCSSDGCDNPTDWIGTYELQGDRICVADTGFFFNPIVVLEPSAVAETFEYEGQGFAVVECTATDGFFNMTKDGNTLTVEIIGSDCSWEFLKQQ